MHRPFRSLSVIALLFTALGCKKHNSPPPPAPPSSQKDITLFEFRNADNPSLLSDLVGSFTNDTIRISLPAQLQVTTLVPYLTFIGKSISPAPASAQNFSSTVTYTVTADDGSTNTYKVVLTHKTALYVTTSDGHLSSIDPVSAHVNWTYQCSTGQLSAPTTGNGMVFTTGDDGLYAVNALDGSLVWKMSITALNDTTNLLVPGPVHPIPILANGIVYGSFADGTIRAVEARTASVKWSFTSSHPFASGPTLYNSALYIAGVDGYIYSLDPGTGTLNWKYKGSGNPIIENPLLLNNVLYVGGQGVDFYALQAGSGQLLWNVPDYLENCSPAAANGTIYSAADNAILAVDPATGSIKWYASHNTGNLGWNGLPSAAIADGRVFAGSLDGNIYAHDAATGHLLWTYYLGATIYSSPVVANGRVYMGAVSGNFVVLNAADGTVLSTLSPGPYPSSICFIDSSGTIYHPAESGEQN